MATCFIPYLYYPVIILFVAINTHVISSLKMTHIQNNCALAGMTFTCDHDLPAHIPDGATEVTVYDYNRGNFTQRKHVFDNPTWQQIKRLIIIINSEWTLFKINNFDFFPLKNLNSIDISSNLVFIEEFGFAGLYSLAHITLVEASFSGLEDFLPAIMSNRSSQNIESLKLHMFQYKPLQPFIVNKQFMKLLQIKGVKLLSLSGNNILFKDLNTEYNTVYPLEYLDISNTTFMSADDTFITLFPNFFQNIKTLNLSGIPHRAFGEINFGYQNKNFTEITILENILKFVNLETIDVSNVFQTNFSVSNVHVTMANFYELRFLSLSNNHIIKMNGSLHFCRPPKVLKIDLSSNDMTYISPGFLKEITSLRALLLSHNALFKMEPFPEFEDLLTTFIGLKHLDMAYNKLDMVPEDMFVNNKALKTLNLKGNHLETITFKMKHLVMLELMNLQENKIQYVDGNILAELKTMVQTRINFYGNPIECSCKSLDFITWLSSATFKSSQRKVYKCDMKGDIISIDKHAVDKSEFLCKRPAIIISVSVSVVVSVAIIIVASTFVRRKIKRMKHKNAIQIYLDDFKHGRLDENYLLFLSYCSLDSERTIYTIYNNLVNTLKDMIGFKNNIICQGDVHFKPGLSILCEIMRCISESSVVIFVVSRAFCASDWCRMEVKEAYEQDKPIILIFIEEIDEKLMHKYLLKIFNRNTRVKFFKEDNGEHKLLPSWAKMCESVILLARENHEKRKENIRIEEETNLIESDQL